jgi:hypothetical protein
MRRPPKDIDRAADADRADPLPVHERLGAEEVHAALKASA